MQRAQIGIIGGSGLYDMAEVTDREERAVATPFGEPSGPYVIGTLRGKRVAFLSRHGTGGRCDRPSGRDLRQHGGAAVFDARRIEAVPSLGDGRHWDDEPARGQ